MTIDADRVRAALDSMEPRLLADALGIRVYRAEHGGRSLRAPCPIHGGDNAQAFVLGSRDGRIMWHCHTSCGRGGDALSLVAELHRLDIRRDFGVVLERAAAIAGVSHDAVAMPPPARRARTPEPPAYPDRDDVTRVWDNGRTMRQGARHALDAGVSAWLSSRGLDGDELHDRGLVVALAPELLPEVPGDAAESVSEPRMPEWASTWYWRGYRAILPLYDVDGRMRSLRARLIRQPSDDEPKALAPRGYAVRGLVLATLPAVRWLRGFDTLTHLVVVEGETDFLTAASAWATYPIVGLVGGASWTMAFAARVPRGAHVLLATDADDAGEKYASEIGGMLVGKCELRRRAGV